MYKSINEYKRVLEQKGYIKDGRLSEDFDGEIEDADFVPHPEDNLDTDFEGSEDVVTFETFKDAIIAEHESECIDEEGEETCAMLDEDQLKIAYEVFLKLTDTEESDDDDDDDDDDEDDDEDDDDDDDKSVNESKNYKALAKTLYNYLKSKKYTAMSDNAKEYDYDIDMTTAKIVALSSDIADDIVSDLKSAGYSKIKNIKNTNEIYVNETLKTSQDVKVSFNGEDLIIPKGTRVTNKTADGKSDPNYNFVDDFSWYKPELKGFARKMAIHDMDHRGINIDSQYVINESKNKKQKNRRH